MNLAHRYGKIFWNTSCLTVNAGAEEENDSNKNTQYGKIAKAIGGIQEKGQLMALPDINVAKFGFSPDLSTQAIIFGLKGICGVGDDIVATIVKNRPYTSLDNFIEKMTKYKLENTDVKFGDSLIIALIKAGCFDKLENKTRQEVMADFIRKISSPVTKLTMSDIPTLYDLGMLTKEQESYEYRLYKFKKYVFSKQFFHKQIGKSDSTAYHIVEERHALPFFYEHFETNMIEGKDYYFTDEGNIAVKKGALDREYDKLMVEFKEKVLLSSENIKSINEFKFNKLWNQYASGTVAKWEMDSLSFYYGEHELAHIDKQEYMIEKFNELPEIPEGTEIYKDNKGQEKTRFKLCRIVGTVLDTDKNKHTVTLLTPDGIAMVKYYKGQFGFYNKQISHTFEDETSKTTLEKSWFKRGNKLLITGYRRGERFYPKKYMDSAYKHTTQLITEIYEDGKIKIQSERINIDEL